MSTRHIIICTIVNFTINFRLVFFSITTVTADEEGEDTVRVCVIIPGLKRKGFLKKNEAENAEIDLKIEER